MTGADGVASMGVVTDLGRADDAAAAATAAAVAAGADIREITDLAELDAVYRLYGGIWRPDPKNPPVTTELLRALTKAGNYVAGAFDGPALVGACVGFFGAPADVVLHSIAGVSPAALGSDVGFALKLHQRAWALLRGVSVIEWTFDARRARRRHRDRRGAGAGPVPGPPDGQGGTGDRGTGRRTARRGQNAGPRTRCGPHQCPLWSVGGHHGFGR
jgi:hypothetical protein